MSFPISVTANIRPLVKEEEEATEMPHTSLAPAPVPASPVQEEVKEVKIEKEVKVEPVELPHFVRVPLPQRQRGSPDLKLPMPPPPPSCDVAVLLHAMGAAFLVGGITGALLCYALSAAPAE